MPRVSPLLAAAVISTAALPAYAKPMTLLDLFSLDRLATAGVQWSVSMLRGFAKTRYVDLSVSPLDGRMVLTGLEVTPYDWPGDCTISLDRAVFSSAPLDQMEFSSLRIDLTGVSISESCVEDSTMQMLAALGVDRLTLDQGIIYLKYDQPSGGTLLEMQAVSTDLAEIRAEFDFDYLAFDAENEEPIAELASAEISVIDHGLLEKLAPLIPPEMTDAEALATAMKQELLPGDIIIHQKSKSRLGGGTEEAPAPTPVEPDPPVIDEPLDMPELDEEPEWEFEDPAPDVWGPEASEEEIAAVSAMIDESAATFAEFLANPGQITLRLAPETPVHLSEDMMDNFVQFALAMNPKVISGAPQAPQPVTTDDLASVESWLGGDEAALSASDAMRIAKAFMTGIGVPRDTARAIQVVEPLLAANDAAAIALALDGLNALPADPAYRIALNAAANGNRDAFARLDKLERALGLKVAIDIQEETPLPAAPVDTQPEALRAEAQAALTGLGAPRRYTLAYYDALLALAAGDTAASAVIDEVETMANRMSADDAADWQSMLNAVRAQATEDWLGQH